MNKIKVKVTWCFEDTEYENLRYPEALQISGLPKTVVIKNFDEEETDIEAYLMEEFLFTPVEWIIID